MKLEGEFEVAASATRLWDFFWDLESLGACLPGCEGVQRVDERTLTGILVARVGPVQARFQGKAIIMENEPPSRVVLKIEGVDSRTASRIRATIEMWLSPRSEYLTRAGYHADIAIIGKLGQFGEGIIKETAGVLLEQFASNIRARLGGGGPPSGPGQVNILRVLIKALWRWLNRGLNRWFRWHTRKKRSFYPPQNQAQ